jgi:urease accessory protein
MRVIRILEDGHHATDCVRLDYDARSRRRAVMQSDQGVEFLLDQERPRHLRGGNAFELEDGRQVRIEAKPESLIDISGPDMSTLVRIAWHLGNRHLPTQISTNNGSSGLRIRTDHVIEAMVTGLGGVCCAIEAPFDPEGGAYEGVPRGHSNDGDHGGHQHVHD